MKLHVLNRIHLLCAYSGLAFALLTLIGIIFLAKFFPPPSPALSTEEVLAIYAGNLDGVRAAMVTMMMGAALFIPFTSLIAHYIIRIEGRVGVISIMQILCVAIVGLTYKGPLQILPRWFCWLSIWVSLLIMPASLVIFFKSGPFAWNGIISWWIPASSFGLYWLLLSWMMGRAVKDHERNAVISTD